MSAELLATQVVSALLLPPLNILLIVLAAFVVSRRRPRIGAGLYVISLLAFLLFGSGAGARLLATPLEAMAPPLTSAKNSGAQAIVVLASGFIPNAPEAGGRGIPTPSTLARLRYAAQLHKETGMPLLVSGGIPDGLRESEAAVMARSLKDDFATPVKWIEAESLNTAQNARLSATILRRAGVERILLVTDSIHMARSMVAFNKSGLQPVAAPTGFVSRESHGALDFVPNGLAMALSYYATHEWIGMLWYRVRYGM
jgi:uncharacterized SAM-binding protein YcdF (DUF218 family)